MTKADIVQAVYTKLGGFSKKEAADLVDQVFDSMKETRRQMREARLGDAGITHQKRARDAERSSCACRGSQRRRL